MSRLDVICYIWKVEVLIIGDNCLISYITYWAVIKLKIQMQINLEKVKDLIAEGKTKKALDEFDSFISELDSLTRIEINSLKSRFNCMLSFQRTNRISFEEASREQSKIDHALLEIVEELQIRDNLKEAISNELTAVEKLSVEYIESKEIKNNSSRLREKNQIVRKITQILLRKPELINEVKESNNQGIISGIASKMRVVPNVEDLRLLKDISSRTSGNYSKGQITNTLAELVYSGQLRIGDDEHILNILNNLKANADLPLSKNIERVETALKYLTD